MFGGCVKWVDIRFCSEIYAPEFTTYFYFYFYLFSFYTHAFFIIDKLALIFNANAYKMINS